MLVDSHCHLTHERYAGEVDEVLGRAAAAGVETVVVVASDLEDARRARKLLGGERSSSSPLLVGTAGIHPHAAAEAPADFLARLDEALDAGSSVVAVGECGLDYHYDLSPRATQRRVFESQLAVAGERGLPAVVHCREAESDMIGIVREAGAAGIRGVLHCFPGDMALLEAAVEAGWMVSFTGLVSFPSWDGDAAVRGVPADSYMLETDGPYMAPVPHRGKRNEPSLVPHIRDRVAELRGEPLEKVARDTTRNARTFFGLRAEPDPRTGPAPPGVPDDPEGPGTTAGGSATGPAPA